MEILASVLMNGHRRIEKDKKFLIRTYNDGTLRAMFSDRYTIIDNIWYMNVIKEALPNAYLSHWKGDADTIYGNVLIPDTVRADKDSDYGGMISISNCEIGLRRLGQTPSLFRAICMNGCIWDQNKGSRISQVHKGKIDYRSLARQIFDNIHSQIPLMNDLVVKFLDTRRFEIVKGDSLKAVFAQVALDNKMTTKEIAKTVEEFVTYEKNDRNLFGIINSITRAGQSFDNDRWVALDFIGGKLMSYDQNDWNRLVSKSRTLKSEEIDKVFGAAA
jgi:hypothetical protein